MTKQPSYRFADYTESWKQRKLSEVTDYKNGKGYEDRQSDFGSYELINLNSISIDGGLKRSGKFIDKADETLEKGDLVMILSDVGHGNLLGRVAIIPESNKFVLNQRVALLRPRLNSNSRFLYSYINSNQYYFKSQGAGMSQLNISKSSVENFSSYLPSLPEQTVIGSFFQDIDQLISLQQRKLEVLKEQKKTYLKLLFPAKGQTKPALRFAGFEDEWKEVKFGEIGVTKSGIGFPDSEQGGVKGIPFYKVSDMNNIGNEIEMVTSNNYVTQEQIDSRKWKVIDTVPAIMFAKVGAALLLNRKRLIREPFLIDNNTMVYIPSVYWDVIFCKILFDTLNLSKYSQVGALPSYNGSDIEAIQVSIPTLPEQEAIGSFFQDLDKAIAKQVEKVNQLKESKQTLLRKMFI